MTVCLAAALISASSEPTVTHLKTVPSISQFDTPARFAKLLSEIG